MIRSVALLLVLMTAAANADSKTKELATGYTKELAACHTRADGVGKAKTGAQSLVDGGAAEFKDDLDALTKGFDAIQAYCAELDATLALIADPKASYKQLEHQLDDRDNKIRALRKSSKQALDSLAPVIARVIPAVNARAGTAAPVVKKTPLAFPSGRKVDAPALAGAWRVSGTQTTDTAEYTEAKASATLSVRAIAGTCTDRKKELPRSAVDAPNAPSKVDFYEWYDKDDRRVRVACRAAKSGSLVAMLDMPAAATWVLEPVLFAMLDAR
ncbi:MAG: hypothetical protein ABJE66_18515 [Deltaproteobacteria bacterium]